MMDKEAALEKFESFYSGDESRDLIESIYALGFVIAKPEAPLKIHVEAMDMSGLTEEFIRKEIVPEIAKVLKSGCSKRELKDALDI